MPITLLTLHSDYVTLHDLADGRKRTVKVDRDVLGRLLIDHSAMINMIRTHGQKVNEPPEPTPKRQRKTLLP
jgi:hypothetical protein